MKRNLLLILVFLVGLPMAGCMKASKFQAERKPSVAGGGLGTTPPSGSESGDPIGTVIGAFDPVAVDSTPGPVVRGLVGDGDGVE